MKKKTTTVLAFALAAIVTGASFHSAQAQNQTRNIAPQNIGPGNVGPPPATNPPPRYREPGRSEVIGGIVGGIIGGIIAGSRERRNNRNNNANFNNGGNFQGGQQPGVPGVASGGGQQPGVPSGNRQVVQTNQGGGFSQAHYQWCQNKYKSYKIETNSFTAYSGQTRYCSSPHN